MSILVEWDGVAVFPQPSASVTVTVALQVPMFAAVSVVVPEHLSVALCAAMAPAVSVATCMTEG